MDMLVLSHHLSGRWRRRGVLSFSPALCGEASVFALLHPSSSLHSCFMGICPEIPGLFFDLNLN